MKKKTPAEVGFETTMNWTSPLLSEWMKREFGLTYSKRGVLKLLHRLGFSHTRLTYTLEKAYQKNKMRFERHLAVLKKTRKWRA
ncbi:helix-turn-helix domain-containing protein [Bacillus sp. 2205SS5-2]|uniref:helix-turn-helix domain-containing protein n=1 Tax=Bacillus sp. 2205SS5-2 TaxID=3109031 RepID=UPI0030047486